MTTDPRTAAREAARAAAAKPNARAARETARLPLATDPSGDRPPGPACTGCGTELDPDGSCFTCSRGKAKTP